MNTNHNQFCVRILIDIPELELLKNDTLCCEPAKRGQLQPGAMVYYKPLKIVGRICPAGNHIYLWFPQAQNRQYIGFHKWANPGKLGFYRVVQRGREV